MVKRLKIKLNNSYESQPSSSNSNSSPNENNTSYEEEIGYPNLPQMLKFNKNKICNDTVNNNNDKEKKLEKIKICGSTVFSSQESDFYGFPYENNDKLTGRKWKIHGQAIFSSQESEFLGFSQVSDSNKLLLNESQNGDEETTCPDDIITNTEIEETDSNVVNNIKNIVKPIREESNSSLKYKITTKKINENGERIYEMISIENSCNAVDMKLSDNDTRKETNNENILNLSFNGKINSLIEIENIETENTLIDNESFTKTMINDSSNDKLNDCEITNNKKDDCDCEITNNKTVENPTLHLDENKYNNDNCIPNENLINILTNNEFSSEILPFEINEEQKYINETSPDLFADHEDINTLKTAHIENITSFIKDVLTETYDDSIILNAIKERDKKLLKKVEHSLSGLPPPPSMTFLQMDLFNMVTAQKDKIFNFFDNLTTCKNEENDEREYLFKPSHKLDEVIKAEWPQILNVQHHGLSYNMSTASEKVELLNLSVINRYIGSETGTSFQLSPSSAKKRAMRLKQIIQSPGSRLSHLAKRRAIFSSANLQINSQKLTANTNSNRQILLNNNKSTTNRRKLKIATPKRKTPGSRKKFARKTPTSSTKKCSGRTVDNIPYGPPSRETSKRALFQSPPQQKPYILMQPKPLIKPEIANRVNKSKRALFSPDKDDSNTNLSQISTASTSSIFGSIENLTKRKRVDDEDSGFHNKKIFRPDTGTILTTENLTPRALKIKSQSFCGNGSGTSGSLANNSKKNSHGKSLIRASSDMTFSSSQLTDSHRKKLLWAVSMALQKKNISVGHLDFKKYATTLAKSVKRLFLEYYYKSNSTSEAMLRLSKKYVYCVMQGKSADDIYLMERNYIDSEKMAAPIKLTGYIAPDDYANLKKLPIKKSNSFAYLSESSVDSFNFSQSYGCSQIQSSQNSEINKFSQDSFLSTNNNINSAINKLPIQPNVSLENSSSKNNLNGFVLRENVDCEQRKSAQKNFTGKDQRNMSPYLEKVRLSSNIKKKCSDFYDLNAVKAKRQLF